MLSEKYTKLQAAGKSFELVFVSSDKGADEFAAYHKEMSFLALPFAARDAKNALSKRFKVSGIPTLVLVDAVTGETITTDGTESFQEDNWETAFPFRPVPFDLRALLGATFRTQQGGSVAVADALSGKDVLGLYFSAHWWCALLAFRRRFILMFRLVALISLFSICLPMC